MAACPHARVVASAGGVKGVAEYHDGLAVEEIGAGDVIDLAGARFSSSRCRWCTGPTRCSRTAPRKPSSMCNDAFGQHLASAERFADEVGADLALEELGIYFANILMPLISPVGKAVEKVVARGWAPTTIAPSHGVIWRGELVERAMAEYARWCANTLRDKVDRGLLHDVGLDRPARQGHRRRGRCRRSRRRAVRPGGHARSRTSRTSCSRRRACCWVRRRCTTGCSTGSPATCSTSRASSLRVASVPVSAATAGRRAPASRSPNAWRRSASPCAQEPFTQKYRPTAEDLAGAAEWGAAFARAIKAGAPAAASDGGTA